MRNNSPRETWEDDLDQDGVGDVAGWENKGAYKDNVAAFSLQLAAVETILKSMKETTLVLDADPKDLLHLESRILSIQREVLWLKRFFIDLEIGAS